MTKEEFFADCESNLVFEDDNIHVTIDDQAICPFCGNEMKWEGRLFCNCKTQVEYFKKKQDIERQINSLNNALKNLKNIYIKDTYSFFAKHFLSQIDTMIDNLKKDRDDVENLIKEEEKWQKQSNGATPALFGEKRVRCANIFTQLDSQKPRCNA